MSKSSCRELDHLLRVVARHESELRVYNLGKVEDRTETFPLLALEIGSGDVSSPVLGVFGGVHGLEKIGSEVCIAFLETALSRKKWDPSFKWLMERSRLLFMPVVNPVGVARARRSNAKGVDLMRNSPLDAEEDGGPFYRGHRWSPLLPYYRGPKEAPMQEEAEALSRIVRERMFPAQSSLALDVHSGFGTLDRMWFPFSYSKKPCPHLPEIHALKHLFDQTYPHHFYAFEPTSKQYTIHGDLWDHLYLEREKTGIPGVFLPWTLEMGSWIWLKKNPSSLFSRYSLFDPILPHRRKRILRRHITLMDFLHRSLLAEPSWWRLSPQGRREHQREAEELWYG